MKFIRPLLIVSGILLIVDFFIYWTKPFSMETLFWYSDLQSVLFASLAVFACLRAYKTFNFQSVAGKVAFFIMLGMLSWLLGEVIWGFYEVVLAIEAPTVSWADAAWLTGYVWFFIGLYYTIKIGVRTLTNNKVLLFTLICIGITAGATFLYVDSNKLQEKMTSAEYVVNVGYPLGDLILFIFVILLFFTISAAGNTLLAQSWLFMSGAFVLDVVADTFYLYFIRGYQSGSLIDIFWQAAYFLMAIAFYKQSRLIEDLQEFMKTKLKRQAVRKLVQRKIIRRKKD